ncbi:MAG: methyltransferase domain-containing protein [Pseudomonadota bacterium]|nr:methyltransferase domain-containing protein [Pseudomonadota bacterium]QKK04603.1 MAG: methyltransferase domain-containing protein [Pseudomonadota bacterium]
MKCRHCQTPLATSFIDLGSAPPSNAYLGKDDLKKPEKWYPLHILVCEHCWLVQTEDYADADELFSEDYAYFSSFSKSWLAHAENFVEKMQARFGLTDASHIVEIASNDGYLLQYVQERGIPCLGIEPTKSTAAASREKGIDTLEEFFGVALAERLAAEGKQADLTAANNVLAHVPDINDFVRGFSLLLKPSGVASFEFPHLMQLVTHGQFDTIYHEHYSYLSLTAVSHIFAANGLTVFDVEELPTHGGSLRVYACRADTEAHKVQDSVSALLAREKAAGMQTAAYYAGFQDKADKIKNDFLEFLLFAKREGKTVAGYGAAAKGNTLLNYAGIRPDLLPFVVDMNPAKQGKFLPGSRIPILPPAAIEERKPDFVIILPWNLRTEIAEQLAYIRSWDGQFVTAVPELEAA